MSQQLPTCNFTKHDGSPCGATVVKDSDFCYFHQEHRRRRRQIENTLMGKVKALEHWMSGAAAGKDPVTHKTYDGLFANLVHELQLPPFEPANDPMAILLSNIFQLVATQQVDSRITQQMLYSCRLALANKVANLKERELDQQAARDAALEAHRSDEGQRGAHHSAEGPHGYSTPSGVREAGSREAHLSAEGAVKTETKEERLLRWQREAEERRVIRCHEQLEHRSKLTAEQRAAEDAAMSPLSFEHYRDNARYFYTELYPDAPIPEYMQEYFVGDEKMALRFAPRSSGAAPAAPLPPSAEQSESESFVSDADESPTKSPEGTKDGSPACSETERSDVERECRESARAASHQIPEKAPGFSPVNQDTSAASHLSAEGPRADEVEARNEDQVRRAQAPAEGPRADEVAARVSGDGKRETDNPERKRAASDTERGSQKELLAV